MFVVCLPSVGILFYFIHNAIVTIEAPHYHVFGSVLPCMLVAIFSTGVQHVISIISTGILIGKTLVEYFWYILYALLLEVSFAITDGVE